MSKETKVVEKVVYIKNAFGKGKDGVCGVYVSNRCLLDFLEEIIEQQREFYIKYKLISIYDYVMQNYENMYDSEIKEMSKLCNVKIGYYTCEDVE